jgi:hypothetical protein
MSCSDDSRADIDSAVDEPETSVGLRDGGNGRDETTEANDCGKVGGCAPDTARDEDGARNGRAGARGGLGEE